MHDEDIGSVLWTTASAEDQPKQRPTDDRLTWTVPEAARLLGISKAAAYEAAHRGELPVQTIGRRMLVPRVALAGRLPSPARRPARWPWPVVRPTPGQGRR